MTDTPISLTAVRWERGDGNPASHPVREALEVALARIDSGEYKADHVIVCMGTTDPTDGSALPSYTQAGDFNTFAQFGLLEAVKRMMLE